MADPQDPAASGHGEKSRKVAGELADQLVPMVQLSRTQDLEFLAYLLGMALKEARRIATAEDKR